MQKTLLFLPLLFLLPSFVVAIAVSPPSQTLPYLPGESVEFSLNVRNTAEIPLRISVAPEGDQVRYVRLPAISERDFQPGEDYAFFFNVTIPLGIALAGQQRLTLTATEGPTSNESVQGISGFASVLAFVYVPIPFPHKYLSIDVRVASFNNGELGGVVLLYTNSGEENLSAIRSTGSLFASDGALITTFRQPAFRLDTGATLQKQVFLSGKDFTPGVYNLTVETEYDGVIAAPISTLFKVGHYAVTLASFTREYKQNRINKIEIKLQNEWNNQIVGVFTEIFISDLRNTSLAHLSSDPATLMPLGSETLTVYWDTGTLRHGPYLAHVILHYGNETSVQDVPIAIIREPSSGTSLTSLFFIGGVLVLLLIEYFLLRKRYRRATYKL